MAVSGALLENFWEKHLTEILMVRILNCVNLFTVFFVEFPVNVCNEAFCPAPHKLEILSIDDH